MAAALHFSCSGFPFSFLELQNIPKRLAVISLISLGTIM
jgi:hypothetical protein